MKRWLRWLLKAMQWIFILGIAAVEICEHKLQEPELVWTHVGGNTERYGARVLPKAKPSEMIVTMIRDQKAYRYKYRHSACSEAGKVFMAALESQIPSICSMVNRTVRGCPEQIEIYIKTRKRGWLSPNFAIRPVRSVASARRGQ